MQQKKHIRFDWAIKRLLRQKVNFGILEGFLSELLKEDIEIVEILDGESNKETEQDKFNRVDVLVKDTKGDLIIIEIQNSYALDYFLRVLYGISKAIIEHMKEGDNYTKVKKIISVNIVYFELGQGNDYIYRGTTSFKGLHDNQPLELTAAQRNLFKKDKIEDVYPEIYLIKVNKFDDNAKDTLDEWIYFLKNSEIKQEFSAKGIKEADEVLKRANMSDQERRDYQRFVEVLSDRASIAMTIDFESTMKAQEMAGDMAEKMAKEIAGEMAEKMAKEIAGEMAEKMAGEMAEKMAGEMAEKMAGEMAEKLASEMAEKMADRIVEERVKEKREQVVNNLLKIGTLTDEQIAEIAQVSVIFVEALRKKTV